MAVSYNRLWKLLVDKKMSKADLRKASGVAPNTMTKLRRDEEVTLTVLGKICKTLNADYGDIMEYIDEEETVCLLSKLNAKQHIEVEIKTDELDLTAAESKATYDEIKGYVLEKHELKVSSLYISQVKRKCGLDVGQNYNLSKKEDAKVPQCPPEKEAAIMEALKYFQMIH